MKKILYSITGFLALATSISNYAQCTYSPGNASGGAFGTLGDTVLTGNEFNFSSFVVGAGHTVTFNATGPIRIYCSGTATVDGTINVNGQNGANGNNNAAPGNGGLGGPGGFNGGRGGGALQFPPFHGDLGSGPGQGIGGPSANVNEGLGGGGGGFGQPGADAVYVGGSPLFGTGFGIGGSAYGDPYLTELIGGSGGGGGGADDDGGSGDDGGGGGGGGGGAIMISASSVTIGATGSILANGGSGGSAGNGGSGGGGAGGGILILSSTIVNNGTISAQGGGSLVNQYTTSQGGNGGLGRIVFNSAATGTGATTPSATIRTGSPSITTVSGCGSVTHMGTTYTSSQTLTNTLAGQAVGGCDSIVVTYIEVKDVVELNFPVALGCDSVFYIDSTYTSSTVVQRDTISGSSCDSVILNDNVIINYATSGSSTIITCDTSGVDIDGTLYYSDTTVTYTIFGGASTGCDSTVTTTLIIDNFAQGNVSLFDCDSVTVFGNTYYASTIARDTVIGGAAAGCDTITVATITIGGSSVSNNVTLNPGESVTVGGNTYNSAGTYTDTLTSAQGCDSIITTIITINVDGFGSTLTGLVKVYPNPMDNMLVIDSEVALDNIRIMDMEGRVVETVRPNDLNVTIETSGLMNGMYIYELTDQDGNVARGKVIKR